MRRFLPILGVVATIGGFGLLDRWLSSPGMPHVGVVIGLTLLATAVFVVAVLWVGSGVTEWIGDHDLTAWAWSVIIVAGVLLYLWDEGGIGSKRAVATMSVTQESRAIGKDSIEGPIYLCLSEKFWTCSGVGDCWVDPSPETLAAWKIDISGSRYALCKRNGSDCTPWTPVRVDGDSQLMVTVYDADHGANSESFKIDPLSGKFAAVRLSGSFLDPLDYMQPPANRKAAELSRLLIRQRTGSCVAISPSGQPAV